ncbi:MAG: hypothetical protein ABI405_12220 [Parafilimonas sp.]
MGWKAFVIIVNNPLQIDNESLLRELGFKNLTKIEDEPFEVAIYPKDNAIYIGNYKDNLLICESNAPMQFFEDAQTKTEKVLTKQFPISEICSIVLHSVVNLWGYSIIKDGQKIRARAGSAEDGTFVDIGEPIEEEAELFSKATINENGVRTYLFEDIDDEPMTEDQVGENFVFAIWKRYFGEELDRADDLLFETILTGYSYDNNTKKIDSTEQKNTSGKIDQKPWWKFW